MRVSEEPARPAEPGGASEHTGQVLQVALLWGERIVSLRHFTPGQIVTLGHGRDDAFHLFSKALGSGYVLARSDGEGWRIRVPEGTPAALQDGDLLRGLGPGGHRFDRGRVTVSFGALTLALRTVSRAPQARVSLRDADFSFFKIAACALLFAAAAVTSIILTPEAESELADDVFSARPPVLRFKPPPPPPEPVKIASAPSSSVARTPARDPGGDGKPPKEGRRGAPRVGITAAIEGLRGIAGSVFDSSTRLDLSAADGLRNRVATAETFDPRGTGGMGTRGTGPGADGPGFGIGGVGTQGREPGGGSPFGNIGNGLRARAVTPVTGPPKIIGGLERDVILKGIKQHEREIKYCYERGLSAKPDLEGKVAVMFTISPAGEVSAAQIAETSLEESTVESCILQRLQRWKFPHPKGGGEVAVTFPWLFRPAGAD